MPHIKIEGLDEIAARLKENATLDDVKKVVQKNGEQMHRKAQNNADFTQGYQTGTTKRSIGLEFTDGGFTAEVEPTTEYAPYLEYGTRFMEAQPFMRPAYNEQKEKFESDIKRLMK